MTTEHDLLKRMLLDAAKIFDSNNKVFWLDCGTLLGFTRDGSFIEWEHDLDLGAWKEEKDLACKRRIASDFRTLGYETYFSDAHVNVGPKGGKVKVCLDINFYERKDNMALKPTFVPKNRLAKISHLLLWSLYDRNILKLRNFRFKIIRNTLMIFFPNLLFHLLPISLREIGLSKIDKIQNTSLFVNKSWMVPTRFFDNLKHIRVLGHDFAVPQDSEGYLEYRYGIDWKRPNRNWDTLTQDKSVKGNRV